MPGQNKTVTVEFDDKYVGENEYKFLMEGWNLNAQEVKTAE
jgi:hypothetical protein